MHHKEQRPSEEAIERLKGMIVTDKARLKWRLTTNAFAEEDEARRPPLRGSRRSGKISTVFRAFEAD